MGVAERKAREREELRQEILEAARELFIKEGYERVSMRRIAERIEYSPTTIYLYFKDKADLMFQICESTFAKLVAAQEQTSAIADPVERLRECLRGYVRFGLEHPEEYTLTFILPYEHHSDSDPARYLEPHTMGMRAFGNLMKSVAECFSSGRFQAGDVEAATQAVWGAAHGITSLLIVHRAFPWKDRQVVTNLLIDKLITGFEGRG